MLQTTRKFSTETTLQHIRIKSIKPKGNIVLSHRISYHQTFSVTHSNTPGLPSSVTTMALQIHHLRPPIPPPVTASISVGSLSSWPTKHSTIAGDLRRSFSLVKTISSKTRKNKGLRYSVRVRSSLETSGPAAVVGQVTEVDKDTFWPIVNAAGDKTVVLDMYTQW